MVTGSWALVTTSSREIMPAVVLVHEKAVQRHHAMLGAGLNVRVNAEGLVVADKSRDRRRVDHHLKDCHPAGLVTARQEQLGDDRLQDRGKLNADLLLLVRERR